MYRVFAGVYVGEFGWENGSWQAFLRHRASVIPGEYIVVSYADRRILYSDFAVFFPIQEGINPDNADSYCHRDISRDEYFKMVGHYMNLVSKRYGAIDEVLTVPYGMVGIERARSKPQLFAPLGDWDVDKQKDMIVVFPRHRNNQEGCRNWGQPRWAELVDWLLSRGKTVVLSGNKEGACLQEMRKDGIINIIGSSLDVTVKYLNKAEYAISQQSGTCSFSLLCGCRLLSFGMASIKHRIEVAENPLKTFCIHYHKDHDKINEIEVGDLKRFVREFESVLQ